MLKQLYHKYLRGKKSGGTIKLIAMGNSILANNKYAGGPGRSAPELLFQNNDHDFPDFAGQDLKSLDPDAQLYQLAEDGGTFDSLMETQTGQLPTRHPDDVVIALLAIGGNDLIARIQDQRKLSELIFGHFVTQLRLVVEFLEENLEPDILLITNTYDPTGGDGTAGAGAYAGVLPVTDARKALLRINGDLKAFCESKGAIHIDLYHRFLGHGFSQSEPWITQHIEPNYKGSHVIRGMVWEVLAKELVKYGFSSSRG